MFNKHFVKTMLLFSFIILLGLVGVMVANSFEGNEESYSQIPSSVQCPFKKDC